MTISRNELVTEIAQLINAGKPYDGVDLGQYNGEYDQIIMDATAEAALIAVAEAGGLNGMEVDPYKLAQDAELGLKTFEDKLRDPASLSKSHQTFDDKTAKWWFDQHFYIVQNLGGQMAVVDRHDESVQSKSKFIESYARHRVTYTVGKDSITESVAQFWLKYSNENFRKRVFIPTGANDAPRDFTDEGLRNVWRGFSPVKADGWDTAQPIPMSIVCGTIKAACPTIYEYLWDVVASERLEVFNYAVKWLADVVQNPRRTAGRTAMVLYSVDEGTGKTTFGTLFTAVVNPKNVMQARMKDLKGDFTAQIENKIGIIVNEFFNVTPNMRGVSGAEAEGVRSFIFDMIDAAKTTIEHKGRTPYEVDNYARLMLSTNKTVVLPSGTARRFAVIEVSNCRMGKIEFWARLNEVMGFDAKGLPLGVGYGAGSGGELDRFFTILSGAELGDFHPQRDRPVTTESTEQRLVNLGSIEGQLLDILQEGKIAWWKEGPDGQVWVRQNTVRAMMEAALGHRLGAAFNETWFGVRVMSKMMTEQGKASQQRGADGVTRKLCFLWPRLCDARKIFEQRFVGGVKVDWNEGDDWELAQHNY